MRLIELDGSVSARIGSGAVGLWLRGEAAGAAPDRRALELLFSGGTQITPVIPPSLHAVRVIELDNGPLTPGERRFRIEASEGQYIVSARSVQRHAAVSGAFFSVLPHARVAPATRWGWSLLLWMLRVLPLVRLTGRPRA
jgi:hypothetical protein